MSSPRLSSTTAGRKHLYDAIPLIPSGKFTAHGIGVSNPGVFVALRGGGYLRKCGRVKVDGAYRALWEPTARFYTKFRGSARKDN